MNVISAEIINNNPVCPKCKNILGETESYKQVITENGESVTMFSRYCNTPTKVCNCEYASYLVDIGENKRWEVGEVQEVNSEESN